MDRARSWRNFATHLAPPPLQLSHPLAPDKRQISTDLVQLRPGCAARPLFMVHGSIGNEPLLQSIAGRLRTDRPICGLQMCGVGQHETPHPTIREMAAAYIQVVRARQPAGPYAIAGASLGGLVAYEMACRLRECGEAVDLLALIEVDFCCGDRAAHLRLTRLWARILRSLRTLTMRPPQQWAKYALRAVRVHLQRWLAPGGVDKQGDRRTGVTHALSPHYIRVFEDIASYRPRRYDGKVSLFRNARAVSARGELLGGLERAAASVEVYDGWDEGLTTVGQPWADAVAKQLERCLAGPGASNNSTGLGRPIGSTIVVPTRIRPRPGGADACDTRLTRLFESLAGQEERIFARSLAIVVAHPDDETIGIGGQLGRLDGVLIVHLTNGAPRPMSYGRTIGFTTRRAYAAARRAEFERAMAQGEVRASALWFNVDDQELVFHLADTARRLAELFAERGIETVLTHPSEGGHPDHDAAALSVRAAATLLARAGGNPPDIGEMAFYHAGPEGLVRQRFPADPAATELALTLDDAAWNRKCRMLAEFVTQRDVMADFDSRIERLRRAPSYDFTTPNRGVLSYDGEQWRYAARAALAELGLAKSAIS